MNTVQVYKGKKGWFIRLVSPNGETLAHSEAYTLKWNAKRAARKNFPGLKLIELPDQSLPS